MNENEWTKIICVKLNDFFEPNNLREYIKLHDGIDLEADIDLHAETRQKIPYSQVISGYSEDWEPEYKDPRPFETDLVIYELKDGKRIPRVIVEAKVKGITSHDAITYSYKAEKHKNLTPHLRYGIMIGEHGDKALPGRLFYHGTNFDFMFSFSFLEDEEPFKTELETFTDMILKEVVYSKTMENILEDSNKKGRTRYYMMQKQLVLAKQDTSTHKKSEEKKNKKK